MSRYSVWASGWKLGVLASACVAAAGCGVTIPYVAALAALPPEDALLIDGRWVRIERAGQGEPVVLIHGFGASTFSWRKVLPELAESFDAIAVDLNGFGYTQRPADEAAYTLAGQAEHVRRVADALGLDSFHVVGHSYGAGVALLMAQEYGGRVRSLTLVDGGLIAEGPGGPSIPPILRPLAQWLVRGLLLTERNIRSALEGAVFDAAVVTDEMVEGYLRPLRVEGFEAAFRGLLGSTDGEQPEVALEGISVPVLVIWGEDDPVFSASAGRRLAEEIAGAVFVSLPRTGHLPMEEKAEEFAEELASFLEQIP